MTSSADAGTGTDPLGPPASICPSIAGAATNPSVNNGGGDGAATVSLRGLGDQRTLLLVNGRRIVTADVNSIPMSMVTALKMILIVHQMILKVGEPVYYTLILMVTNIIAGFLRNVMARKRIYLMI